MSEIERVLSLVFPYSYPWGASNAAPARVIHVYSAGRPRWAAQLCRMAGEEAVKVKDDRIKFGHLKQVLESYGRYRLDDISREHRHQCEQVPLIVNAFSNQPALFTTEDLLQFIHTEVLGKLKVLVDEVPVSNEVTIARFLFRTGFLLGRSRKGKTLAYYNFEEKPDLLINHSNLDDGLSWYVHPSFHSALALKS